MENVEIVREKLKTELPLLQQMAVDIVEYQPGHVIVEAPLEPNLNTHGTAFGGSLYCVATMCGWSMVHLTLMDAGFEPSVWVTKGEVEYLVPVTGALRAEAKVSLEKCQALIDGYREKGKARMDITVEIYQGDALAMQLNATFAAR
ncbi:MAG: thioesterase domain-containing protein [Pseudomonadales bacterium]|nr:thioesterase domain-containing protein [Pseudomonadales bacterium]